MVVPVHTLCCAEIRQLVAVSELIESEVANRYETIMAPADGRIFDLKPWGPGYVARNPCFYLVGTAFGLVFFAAVVMCSGLWLCLLTGQSTACSVSPTPSND